MTRSTSGDIGLHTIYKLLIVVENGQDKQGSNPRQSYLHFTLQ